MRPDKKIKSYARALLNVAIKNDAVPAVGSSLQDVAGLLRKVPAFKVFFHTRRIPVSEKFGILRDVLSKAVHPIVLEFLVLLVEDRDTLLLPDVAHQYSRFQVAALNQIPLMIYSAEPLTDEQAESIIQRLEASTGKTLDATRIVDPSLLGGIKLRLGNVYLDASLSKQLDHLKQFILKN